MNNCNTASDTEKNNPDSKINFSHVIDYRSEPSSTKKQIPSSDTEFYDCNIENNEITTDNRSRYGAIDLFAGIGGIRLGFQQAFGENFEVKMASEIDSNAVKTYMANFQTPETVEGDITAIDSKSIPDFDICMAGFPCQAFSNAGYKKGFRDETRGTLFYDIIRICNDKRPMVIFCENVKGLISIDKGRTFKTILKSFKEIGYTPYWDVLNSKHYDTPQNRERVYIVAFRNEIDSKNFKFPDSKKVTKTLKDILEKDPVDCSYFLSEQYFQTLERHRKNHESKGQGFGYLIKEPSDIASAVICGGMGRERNLLYDERTELPDINPRTKRPFNKKNIRVMTPNEWTRLQKFPEDFIFPVPKTRKYMQLGNSVTVSVIKAIAENIKPILDEHVRTSTQDSPKCNK